MSDPGRIFSHSELKQMMREALAEELPVAMRREFELVGLDTTEPDSRTAIRKDMELLRNLRTYWDNTSHKIGNAVIWCALAGLLALIGLGIRNRYLP